MGRTRTTSSPREGEGGAGLALSSTTAPWSPSSNRSAIASKLWPDHARNGSDDRDEVEIGGRLRPRPCPPRRRGGRGGPPCLRLRRRSRRRLRRRRRRGRGSGVDALAQLRGGTARLRRAGAGRGDPLLPRRRLGHRRRHALGPRWLHGGGALSIGAYAPTGRPATRGARCCAESTARTDSRSRMAATPSTRRATFSAISTCADARHGQRLLPLQRYRRCRRSTTWRSTDSASASTSPAPIRAHRIRNATDGTTGWCCAIRPSPTTTLRDGSVRRTGRRS